MIGSPATTMEARRMSHAGTATSRMARLFEPVDGASLAVFRILFGLIMAWEVWRYASAGWIATHFLDPEWRFPYPGFAWVTPWPGDGMYWHFAAMGVLAVLIALGLFYRLATALFAIAFAYVFLLDQARYLNHFYLVLLFAVLMVFVPANRVWSLDALMSRRTRPGFVPAWSLWLLRAQLEIVLVFAGLVKIDRDWLRLEPLATWLARNSDMPLVGPLLLTDTVAAIGVWSAILIHLVGAPLLLFRATRIWAFAAYVVFHLMNAALWNIGIFPWFTIAATLLFFDPDWPRRIWSRFTGAAATIPAVPAPMPSHARRHAILALAGCWLVVQILVPLRFLAYPGFVSWHEQGHNFSWQMMLRDKDGIVLFAVHDPATGEEWLVEPADFLTTRQVRKMAGRPELIRLFAHRLQAVWRDEHGMEDVEVRALTSASLNGRPAQPLVDPSRDLTKVGYTWGPSDWIMPLAHPLPPIEARWREDFWDGISALIEQRGADSG